MVDESGSIGTGSFNVTKSFLSQLVGLLDVDSGNTRMGLVTFSSSARKHFDLTTHSSASSIQSAILSLRYSRGSTNTAGALSYVRTTMLTSAAGDRPNVPNVVVLMTDGKSNNEAATVVSKQLNISL